MEEETIEVLQRDLLQVLVGAVHRVSGLETNRRLPAALCDQAPNLERSEVVAGEAGGGARQGRHRSADGPVARALEQLHTGVGAVIRPVDVPGLAGGVRAIDVGDVQDRHRRAVRAQRHPRHVA